MKDRNTKILETGLRVVDRDLITTKNGKKILKGWSSWLEDYKKKYG